MYKVAFAALALMMIYPAAATAQDSTAACTSPGSISFADFPNRRADIAPSIANQIAGIGRLAAANNCQIEVTCASAPGADADARRTRNQQCSVAVQSVVRYESRANVRSALQKEIKQNRIAATPQFRAGTVYITLK